MPLAWTVCLTSVWLQLIKQNIPQKEVIKLRILKKDNFIFRLSEEKARQCQNSHLHLQAQEIRWPFLRKPSQVCAIRCHWPQLCWLMEWTKESSASLLPQPQMNAQSALLRHQVIENSSFPSNMQWNSERGSGPPVLCICQYWIPPLWFGSVSHISHKDTRGCNEVKQ